MALMLLCCTTESACLFCTDSPAAALAQASHVVAYLHWDGEATKQDLAAAIKHFRLSALCGCQDAQLLLGSLERTGQYA